MVVAPFFLNRMLGADGCVRFVPEADVPGQDRFNGINCPYAF